MGGKDKHTEGIYGEREGGGERVLELTVPPLSNVILLHINLQTGRLLGDKKEEKIWKTSGSPLLIEK